MRMQSAEQDIGCIQILVTYHIILVSYHKQYHIYNEYIKHVQCFLISALCASNLSALTIQTNWKSLKLLSCMHSTVWICCSFS